MLPTGVIYGPRQTLTVMATGQLSDAAQFRDMVVSYHNGAPVHLGDLGTVLDDVQNNKGAAWFWAGRNLDLSVILAVTRQPGTNTVAVTNAVKTELADIERELPTSVKVNTLYDRSISIGRAVSDTKFSLELALALVVLVIFLFLRNLTATIIPSLALPMAVVGTFSVMYLLQLQHRHAVADGAHAGGRLRRRRRHCDAGEYRPPHSRSERHRLDAAFKGAEEVGFTILSMTLSLAAVFIPLLFMGGIIGKLFNEFAVTIIVSILVSGFVSLTLTPMLCSRFLKPTLAGGHGRMYAAFERAFQAALHAYERSLEFVMRHRPLTLVFSVLILVLTGVLFRFVPKGLFPPDDTGQLMATTEAAQGTSWDAIVTLQQKATALLSKDPYVLKYMSALGGNGTGGATNQGTLFITLVDPAKRPSADVCVAEITQRLSGIPGLAVYLQNPPSIRIGGRSSKALYQYTLQSSDINELYASALKLVGVLQKLKTITDVTTDLLNTNPTVLVQIDRQRAATLGITPAVVENTLADAYNEQQVSTIYTPTNEYWVVMEVLPSAQTDMTDLENLYVRTSNGTVTPLSNIAKLVRTTTPTTVNHSGQVPSVTISFNVPPNGNLGGVVTQVEPSRARCCRPAITYGFSGQAQAFQASESNLGVLLIVTVFVIYIILGILYESFVHPITILTGLPFATFGALFALFVTRVELDVYGYVGIIMLIGIVKKNAIMMIDFAIAAERAEHTTPEQAIVAGGERAVPADHDDDGRRDHGHAADRDRHRRHRRLAPAARRSLVVGGLAFSQIVTLYVTPVFYTYLDELQAGSPSSHRRGATGTTPPPAHRRSRSGTSPVTGD